MNGIVFSNFAYSNLFPRIAYNFLSAEPASLGPGENPASCFHPQMWFRRDEVCGVPCWKSCHSHPWTVTLTGHSLSHSLPQATPWGFFLAEWIPQVVVTAASPTPDPSFKESCSKTRGPCALEYLHPTNPIMNANIHVGTEVGLILFSFLNIYLVVPGLTCSMWDLTPWLGIKLGPLHWERRVSATGSAGKSLVIWF